MKSQAPEDLVNKVMEHYKNNEFADAIQIMLKNKESFDRGDFHYNLGTLFLKQKNFVGARYQLESAIKTGRIENAVFNNLETSKMALGVQEIESGQPFWSRQADNMFQIPVSYFLSLGLSVAIVCLVYQKVKKARDVVQFLVVMGIAFLPLVVKLSFFSNAQYAITFNEIELREGPAAAFEVTRTLPKGLKIVIGEKAEGWVMVKSPIEYSGWAPIDKLGIL